MINDLFTGKFTKTIYHIAQFALNARAIKQKLLQVNPETTQSPQIKTDSSPFWVFYDGFTS